MSSHKCHTFDHCPSRHVGFGSVQRFPRRRRIGSRDVWAASIRPPYYAQISLSQRQISRTMHLRHSFHRPMVPRCSNIFLVAAPSFHVIQLFSRDPTLFTLSQSSLRSLLQIRATYTTTGCAEWSCRSLSPLFDRYGCGTCTNACCLHHLASISSLRSARSPKDHWGR